MSNNGLFLIGKLESVSDIVLRGTYSLFTTSSVIMLCRNSCNCYLKRSHGLIMREIWVFARPWKSSGMFKLYFVKEKSFYDSLMFGLFPVDENSTPQTRWLTYDFHSPGSFDTRIG